MKTLFIVFLFALIGVVQANICVQSTTTLNVRNAPAGSVVGSLSTGERTRIRSDFVRYAVLGRGYFWVPIEKYNGWVAVDFLQACPGCIKVEADGLNVRSSPCGALATTYSRGTQKNLASQSLRACNFGSTAYAWVQTSDGWTVVNWLSNSCGGGSPSVPPTPSGGCNDNRKISRSIGQRGLDIIKKWEGKRNCYYIDPVGYPTICYGHLIVAGDPYRSGTCLSDAQCESLLRDRDVPRYADCVNRYINVPLNQNQFDALTSFTFNLGCGSLQSSTLRTKLNQGDYGSVCSELKRWVRAGGRVLQGLVNRRNDECNLFQSCQGITPIQSSITCNEANDCDSCILTSSPDILAILNDTRDTSCSNSNWNNLATDYCASNPWECYYLSRSVNGSVPTCPSCNYSEPSLPEPEDDVNVGCLNSFGRLCEGVDCQFIGNNNTQCDENTGQCTSSDDGTIDVENCQAENQKDKDDDKDKESASNVLSLSVLFVITLCVSLLV